MSEQGEAVVGTSFGPRRGPNVKGGAQADGSLIYAVIECARRECRMKRVVSAWAESETTGLVVTGEACPRCYNTTGRLMTVARVNPEAAAGGVAAAEEPLGDTSTEVGHTVACGRCFSRYVREYEEQRCPNCGEMKPVSIHADILRRKKEEVGNPLPAGVKSAPCPNCGTMKPENRPCPNCQKAA